VDDMMEAWLIQEYCDEGTLLEATDQWRAAGPEEFMVSIAAADGLCCRMCSAAHLHGVHTPLVPEVGCCDSWWLGGLPAECDMPHFIVQLCL
jgi:hypothetical protein